MALTEELGIAQFVPSISGSGGVFGGGDLLIIIMWGLCLVLLLGIGGIFIWRHYQYKYRVILNEPRGRTLLRGVTEARKIEEKDGSKRWFIKSIKKKVRIPNLEVINPSMEKRLREGVIELLRVDEETFIAVNVAYEMKEAEKDYEVKIVPLANSLNNIRQIHSDLVRDYSSQNWFAANATMLISGGILLTAVGACVFTVIMLQDQAGAINAGTGALSNAINTITPVIENMNACNVAQITP